MRLVSTAEQGMGISDLARRLKISKGTIHGIATALEEEGALRRDPITKHYALGYTLFELGRRTNMPMDLKQIARPFMEKLMQETKVSVFLGVLNRDHVTIIDGVESISDLKITAQTGTNLPLLAGATGKVVMAAMDDAQVRAIVSTKGLPKHTENSIVALGEFLEQIRQARIKGYATDDEEYIPGVRAVASPIRATGQPLYAIWAVGFKASLDDRKLEELGQAIREAAETISRNIEGLDTQA